MIEAQFAKMALIQLEQKNTKQFNEYQFRVIREANHLTF